jgi:Flp pilus assembly pilin Flp
VPLSGGPNRLLDDLEMAMWLLAQFWRDEGGSTITEYALIAGFISVGLIAAFNTIGSKVNHMFVPIGNGLN